MLRKIYLVSPEYLKTITSNNSSTRHPPPPPPKMARKATGAGKKHGGKRRYVKNTKKKKGTVKRVYDRWVTARATARREYDKWFNTLNAELKPICHFLALLGAHHFLHVSRIRVKVKAKLHEADVERKTDKYRSRFLKASITGLLPA